MQNTIMKIGLTGSIGSGKSTVSSFLRQNGFKVIDADKITKDIYITNSGVAKRIKNSFGEEYIVDGSIDTKSLGKLIFSDESKRKTLEEIVIPEIKNIIFEKIKKYSDEGVKAVIVDAPTLIENGLDKHMDKNILVSLDNETRIRRVMQRDNISREDVIKRINAQLSEDEKRKYVDLIIDNSNSLENSYTQVMSAFKEWGLI